MTPEEICRPGKMTIEEARQAAKEQAKANPRFDSEIAHWLSRHNFAEDNVVDDGVAMRALEILEAIGGECSRVLPLLIRLQRSGGPKVRSKAAALMARSNRNPAWYRSLFEGEDPRTLANAIESLWGSSWSGARAIFFEGAASANNRVAGNSIVGFHSVGDLREVEERLAALASDPDARRRASAAWLIGVIDHPPLAPALTCLAQDPDPAVRRNAVRSLVRIRKYRSA